MAAVLEDAVRRGLNPSKQRAKGRYAVLATGREGFGPGRISLPTPVSSRRWTKADRSMLCVDVNVVVYAHRNDLPEHSDYRRLLERPANGDQPLGLPDLALGDFVRVMTNRRIFTEPTSSGEAWEAVDDLLATPAAMQLRAGQRHWGLFRQLAGDIDARSNDIADAYLAAYALWIWKSDRRCPA